MSRPDVNVVVSGPIQGHQTYKTVVLKSNIGFAEQVTDPNTKYVIKWNFDLGGGTFDIDFSNADTHTVAEVTYYYIPFIADESKYTLIDDTLVFIDAEWNGLSAREIKPEKGTLFMIASITGGLHKNGYGINVVTVPENCILEFDGGSLDNGVIVGQNTLVINVGDVEIFGKNLIQEGTWRYKQGSSEMPYKYFEKDILENGSIIDLDGAYYITDQAVRTKRYYSLEGLSYITFNNYSGGSTVVLPYNIFYYDEEFYYMGSSGWKGSDILYIPVGAKYCRMVFAVANVGRDIDTIGGLKKKSNILEQPNYEYEPSFNEQKKQEGAEVATKTIDVSTLAPSGFAINSSDNTWIATNPEKYAAAIIPVNYKGIRYDHIYIKANSEPKNGGGVRGFLIAFVKGYGIYGGSQVMLSDSIPTMVYSQVTSELDEEIPSDATWIYIYLNGMDGSTPINWRPVALSFSKKNTGLAKVADRVSVLENREYNTYMDSGITKLKVCTWNLGHFYNGSIRTNFETESDYQDAKSKIRDLLYGTVGDKIRADIISLNEYSDNIETKDGHIHSVSRDIFPFYARNIIGTTKRYTKNAVYSNAALYQVSKYIPVTDEYVPSDGPNLGLTYFTDQYLIESLITIGRTNVTLVTAHILGFTNIVHGVDRTQFAQFIINRYAGYSMVVILGDFNTYSTDLDAFENAGYTVLNKTLNTHYNEESGQAHILDNVLYKGVDISDLKVYTEPDSPAYPDDYPEGRVIIEDYPVGISDHYPVSFTITASRPQWCPVGTPFFDINFFNKALFFTGAAGSYKGWVDANGLNPSLIKPDEFVGCGFSIGTRSSESTLYNKWVPSENYFGAVVDITKYRGDICIVTKNDDNNALFAFVTEYPSAPADPGDPLVDVAYATGWSGVAYVTDAPVSVTVPADAKYLYVYMKGGDYVFTPKEVKFT